MDTIVKVFEASHIWKENKSFLSRRTCHLSPPWRSMKFAAADDARLEWILEFDLNYATELFFALKPSKLVNQLTAKYRLIFYDAMMKEAEVVSKLHVFTGDSSISETMLSVEGIYGNIASNDGLTVGCEVKYFYTTDIFAEPNFNLQFLNSKLHCFKNLKLMLEYNKLSDVEINIGDQTFRAHKAILAAASPVFLAMFQSGMTEAEQNSIDIDDIDEETFEQLLNFIYNGRVKNCETAAYTLFAAADKYAIDELKKICQYILYKSLNAENAVKVLILSHRHSVVDLKKAAIEFMRLQSVDITKSEDFRTMIVPNDDLLAEVMHALTII